MAAGSTSIDVIDTHSLDYFSYVISKENIPYLPENWAEAKVFFKLNLGGLFRGSFCGREVGSW